MKKTTTIKIDEETLITAKKQIPNISQWIETALRQYLGLDDMVVAGVEEELETIRKAKLNIHLLTKDKEVQTADQELNTKTLNNAWLRVWSPYRTNETIHEISAMEVAGLLGLSYDELVEMMDDLITYVPKNDLALCDDFSYAKSVLEKVKL